MVETIMAHWELRLTVLFLAVVAYGVLLGIGSAWLDNRAARRESDV